MAEWVTLRLGNGTLRFDESRERVVVGDRAFWPELFADFESVDGQPCLQMELAIVDGRPQCRKLTIEAVPGGREVMPLDLAAIDLPTLVEALFVVDHLQLDHLSDGTPVWFKLGYPNNKDGDAAQLAAMRSVQRMRKGRGARTLDDNFFRRVAETYRENLAGGTPTKAIREQFGVSDRMASKYVQGARERGFLGTAEKGKAGDL